MNKQIEEQADRLHKLISSHYIIPPKHLYILTQNISIFHYSHGSVDTPNGPKIKLVYFSTGNQETQYDNIVWEGVGSLDKAKAHLDNLLEDGFMIIAKGEWACFALTYYFYNSLKQMFRKHFLKSLIETLMLKFSGFMINKYDLEFLVKVEQDTYGKERPFKRSAK